LEFGNVGLYGGRKTGEAGEKLLKQGENQQQTQLTYMALGQNQTWVTYWWEASALTTVASLLPIKLRVWLSDVSHFHDPFLYCFTSSALSTE